MSSNLKGVFRLLIIFVGAGLAISLCFFFSPAGHVEYNVIATNNGTVSGGEQQASELHTYAQTIALPARQANVGTAVLQKSDKSTIQPQSSTRTVYRTVKQDIRSVDAGASKLHSLMMQKRVKGLSAHEAVCERALSLESRQETPFGVQLWGRVIAEHKKSKFGDCRNGEKNSGCSAFAAQGLQDVFLYTAMWRHLNRTGVYIDLAANDYFYISNTFFADHCLKFDGICIEANPRYHQELQTKRRCMLEKICVAEKVKSVEFNFQGVFGGIVGAKKPGLGASDIHTMTCQPLKAIFRKYGLRHVDYMNLDVEGVELQCLQGIDWSEVTIDVIGIEVNPNFYILENFLVSKGYVRTVTIAHDAIFVHKSAKTALQILNAWRRDECPGLNEALRQDFHGKNVVPKC